MKKKKEEKNAFFDGRIWPKILDFNVNLDSELVSKSNFIFSASTIILIFILNKVITKEVNLLTNLPWIILLVGTFITSLLSMMVILPKLRIFSKKERIKEDLFYYKNIINYYSREEYYAAIKDLPTDNKRTGEAYANQIYSLAKNILPYKFKMLKLAGWTLVISFLLSILSYFFTLFFF